ncbi:tail fiber domain-containing protein [Escherichia coli]|uniref:tail fiber domain-containing protein n=1 Tax=Escherichia coli TaxID=562 RepID=UPI000DA5D93D|nr:tail fiber domain-containing protein [Escherichia coli]SQP32695.1 Phage tail fiber repeat [Escherichia coli]SQR23052.1 Phage tail fiber repeat [Escherichia coli]
MQSIQFKRTQTAGKKPTPEQLSQGEIALQLADHVIYTKDKNNNVVQISVSPEKHAELNTKVDNNKTSTDRVIASNKQEAANNLASAKAELNQTITSTRDALNASITAGDTAANKRIDALTTTVGNNKTEAANALAAAKTELNQTITSTRDTINATINKNKTDINARVDQTNTNVTNLTNTVAANKSAIEKTVADNKKDADTKITNLTSTVSANKTAIERTVANNKASADAAIAAANQRIDSIEGSADAAYIKKNTNTKHGGYLLTKTANYLEDQTARDLNYFGAFRTNGQDGLMDLTLNVPHSAGKAHGRGFTFRYASGGSRVETYGFDREGQKNFSYKMYHEGDKPTPGEIGAYTKAEVDKMFVKNVVMSVPNSSENVSAYFKLATATIPQDGRSVFFRIHGGNGFNVTAYDQVDIVEIVIRSGNNRPKGLNVIAYRRNTNKDFEVFAVNTSGDNYDIYVKYQRYTDNVIVEYGKSVYVSLTVYDTPEATLIKPSVGVIGGRNVTLFNTENKRGVLSFDDNTQNSYDIVHLSNDRGTGRKYIRKFRSNYNEMIWHETVQGATYRLATGATDVQDILTVESVSSIAGTHKGNITSGRMMLNGGSNAITLRRPAGQSNHIAFQDNRTGAITRQGWIGYANADTNVFEWYSDVGGSSIRQHIDGQIEFQTGNMKRVYTNGQFISLYADGFRTVYGNYGSWWRNDGSNVYLMSTKSGDTMGSWNTFRPFIYSLANGNVTLGGSDAGNHLMRLNNESKRVEVNATTHLGSRLYWERNDEGSKSVFFVKSWGNETRRQVWELADETSYHLYSQRDANGSIQFRVAGSLETGGRAQINGDLVVTNVLRTNNQIQIYRDNNKELWFKDANGTNRGVIWGDSTGQMRIRNYNSGEFDHVFQTGMIRLERGYANGSDRGLIRGEVQGGAWSEWKSRAAGLLVDCPAAQNSAYNVWKATKWGLDHIAAMGVHVPSGVITNAMARLHIHTTNFDFNASGDFSAGRNGSFNDVYIRSDRRLKVNLEELKDDALEKVNSLKVYSYDKVKSLKDRSVIKREVGIIAQDLEEVLPEAVTTSKIGDPDKPEEILTISNSAVNALIIKAIQEVDAKYQAKIEALTKEIAELKATK